MLNMLSTKCVSDLFLLPHFCNPIPSGDLKVSPRAMQASTSGLFLLVCLLVKLLFSGQLTRHKAGLSKGIISKEGSLSLFKIGFVFQNISRTYIKIVVQLFVVQITWKMETHMEKRDLIQQTIRYLCPYNYIGNGRNQD